MLIKVLVLFSKKKVIIPNKMEVLLFCQVLQPTLEALLVFLFTRKLTCARQNARVPCKVKSSKPTYMYFPGRFPLPPGAISPSLQVYKERKHLSIEKYFQNSVTLSAKALNSQGNREGTGKLGVCLKNRMLFTCKKALGPV